VNLRQQVGVELDLGIVFGAGGDVGQAGVERSEEAGQVAVEAKAGSNVCKAFTGVKAAIHQNHGLLTASRHSIDSSAFWFIALERCCQQQLMIDATGHTPIRIPDDRARYSREHVGSEYIGWLHFQPIYDRLEATRPDMFN